MKKGCLASLMICALLLLSCCGSDISHYDMWASFDCPSDMKVDEKEESITVSDDTVTMFLLRRDASSYASESSSGWDRERLDTQSGAFDGNFNNILFVFDFFKYLAGDDMTVSPPTEYSLGADGLHAFGCTFTASGSFGYMYETVQDGVLYVIVIKIMDDISAEKQYSDTVSVFTESLIFE